jgi:hypothetical protein
MISLDDNMVYLYEIPRKPRDTLESAIEARYILTDEKSCAGSAEMPKEGDGDANGYTTKTRKQSWGTWMARLMRDLFFPAGCT